MKLQVNEGKMVGSYGAGQIIDTEKHDGLNAHRLIESGAVTVVDGNPVTELPAGFDVVSTPEYQELAAERDDLLARLTDPNGTATGKAKTEQTESDSEAAGYQARIEELQKQVDEAKQAEEIANGEAASAKENAIALEQERDSYRSERDEAHERNDVLANVLEAVKPSSKSEWERLDEKSLRAWATFAKVDVPASATKADLHQALTPFKEAA